MERFTRLLNGLGARGATENARAELASVHDLERRAALLARKVDRLGSADAPLASAAVARVA